MNIEFLKQTLSLINDLNKEDYDFTLKIKYHYYDNIYINDSYVVKALGYYIDNFGESFSLISNHYDIISNPYNKYLESNFLDEKHFNLIQKKFRYGKLLNNEVNYEIDIEYMSDKIFKILNVV